MSPPQPPDYLAGKTKSGRKGPALLLRNGKWCGHGEPRFGVFELNWGGEALFQIRLPKDGGEISIPGVEVCAAESKRTFLAYDPRQHPASAFSQEKEALSLGPFLRCPHCREASFSAAVGFEIPSDSQSENDTSWFALAVECSKCKWSRIIFEDETA